VQVTGEDSSHIRPGDHVCERLLVVELDQLGGALDVTARECVCDVMLMEK